MTLLRLNDAHTVLSSVISLNFLISFFPNCFYVFAVHVHDVLCARSCYVYSVPADAIIRRDQMTGEACGERQLGKRAAQGHLAG